MGGKVLETGSNQNIFYFNLKLHQSTLCINTGSHDHSYVKAQTYGAFLYLQYYSI